MPLKVALAKVDIVKPMCHHLIGEEHAFWHRAVVGFGVMFLGVTLAHEAVEIHNHYLATCCDLVGYSIHGFGLIPFVEGLIAIGE